MRMLSTSREPCSPMMRARERSLNKVSIAIAIESGLGATTNPLTLSRMNSSVPPLSVRVITGFPE